MNLPRPLSTAAALLLLAAAAAAGMAAGLASATLGGDPTLADTGAPNITPFVVGGAVFLGAGGLLLAVALYTHHRAAVTAADGPAEEDETSHGSSERDPE